MKNCSIKAEKHLLKSSRHIENTFCFNREVPDSILLSFSIDARLQGEKIKITNNFLSNKQNIDNHFLSTKTTNLINLNCFGDKKELFISDIDLNLQK